MYKHSRSGLNLTLFRAYSPTLGRWLSRDPVGESIGTNLYAYVRNSPVDLVDPLGLLYYSSVEGNTLILQIPINYTEPGSVNTALTNEMNAQIERYWSGEFGDITVKTTVVEAINPEYSNVIEIPIMGPNLFTSPETNSGIWPLQGIGNFTTWGAAHEVGHLLGFEDEYFIYPGWSLQNDIMSGKYGTYPSNEQIKDLFERAKKCNSSK